MKLITIVCAVLPFAFVGGIVNLNLAVWRHGNDPAVFVDFFFGAITCLVIGSGIGRWIFNKGEKQKDSTCEVVGSAATFDTMLGPDFEPSFLKSVLVFSSNMRVIAAVSMLDTFVEDETIGEDRRLLFLNIRQQTCMAMEDVGAYLYAFTRKQAGKDFLKALTNYGNPDVYLSNLFKDKTDEEIADAFGFGEIPAPLKEYGYTKDDNATAAGQFVTHFKTLATSQDQMRLGCNKLKHAGLSYMPEAKNELRILIKEDGEPKPSAIRYDPDGLSKLLFVTAMCSIQIKEVVFRYLAIHHPDTWKECSESDVVGEDYERVLQLLQRFRQGL